MKKGFTLIELLVVIAIIAVLAAILFPVFIVAKSKGQQTRCMANMRQIGAAILRYSDDWDGYTPYPHPIGSMSPWWPSNPSYVNQYTWRNRIIPYMKSEKVLKCPVKTYRANLTAMAGKDRTHYGMNIYLIYVNRPANKQGFVNLQSEVPQATRTILVAENWDGDWSAEPFNNTGTGIEGRWWPYHPMEGETNMVKGGVFVYCDGHAGWLSITQAESNGFWLWKRDKNR